MSNKLAEIANDTYNSVERGYYDDITVRVAIDTPMSSLIHPEDWDDIYDAVMMLPAMHEEDPLDIVVEKSTTLQAALALARCEETNGSLMLLNFASARHPGGGWLNGADAQEESLARASNLVASLELWPRYYRINRTEGGRIYTDHAIWSPRVAFFRSDNGNLFAPPVLANVLTLPAPNLSNLEPDEDRGPLYAAAEMAIYNRIKNIFMLAAFYQQRYLVLGAWGCGIFNNSPSFVSQMFKNHLQIWGRCFKKVVFAIYDTSKNQAIYNTFHTTFKEMP